MFFRPSRYLYLRQWASEGRLTFSFLLLPSDIPNNIFHALGDGFQLDSVVSVPCDPQPPATTLVPRLHAHEFFVLSVYPPNGESHVHDHSTGTNTSLNVSVHDSILFSAILPEYGYFEKDERTREVTARCDAIGIHESLEISFGDACLL